MFHRKFAQNHTPALTFSFRYMWEVGGQFSDQKRGALAIEAFL